MTRLRDRKKIIQILSIAMGLCGFYLIIAWGSYSPLDNAWSISNNITQIPLNKTGNLGAGIIDLLFSAFGQATIIIPIAFILPLLYGILCDFKFSIRRGYLFFKIINFLLFIVGNSMLFHIILSNSKYYISGGFIGGILTKLISSYIGVVGVLLISIIFIVMGFYFCLGKMITSLSQEFYTWLTATEEEKQAAALERKLAKKERKRSIQEVYVELEEKTEQSEEEITEQNEQLTDVTRFTRPIPKITRFENRVGIIEDTKETAENIVPFLEEDLTDERRKAEKVNEVEKLSISEKLKIKMDSIQPMFNTQKQTEGFSESLIDDNLPKVRLVSEDSSVPLEEKIAQQSTPEVKIEQEVEPVEMEKQKNINIPDKKDINIEQEKEQTTQYPKGYGATLVHPLLQQHTKIPKPTTPLPTLNLMDKPPAEKQMVTEQEVYAISARIEKALADFGIKATVEDVLIGPVVTRYEIQLAPGVKSSKVMNISSDLARALMFQAIRITEVVPGKPYMGIETPNSHRETVWLRDIFESNEFQNTKAKLPMALGKDISGKSVVIDMSKMPHLLVAGQTGGGKSVGVNTMILSLLYKLTPEQVRFIMIDPKMVELSIYDDIPHLLTPVVTDMKKASNALRWVVDEMERRYIFLKHLSVRNIDGYNDKIKQAADMNLPIPDPTWKPGDSMDMLPPPLEKLSYIVVIIDEFSDLIMTQGKQIEEYIIRIGQKARAAGIHLILATQRPSADVITGLIKSNIPSRIAFTVASQIDSRTILDKGGAESLLGRGDMLYSAAGTPDIIRIHGAFMKDEDVQRVTDNWRARGKPQYIESVVASSESDDSSSASSDNGDLDPLFDEVVEFVIESGVTSATGVQRRFSIGFPRAARILDQLQQQGILSEPDNRSKREILV